MVELHTSSIVCRHLSNVALIAMVGDDDSPNELWMILPNRVRLTIGGDDDFSLAVCRESAFNEAARDVPELVLSVAVFVGVGDSAITLFCEFRRILIVDADGGDRINLLTRAGSGTDFLNIPIITVDGDLNKESVSHVETVD